MVKNIELTTEEQSFLGSMMGSKNVKPTAKIEEYREKYGCDPCDACGPSSCADCKACVESEIITHPDKKY